jgi:hypothetical protein
MSDPSSAFSSRSGAARPLPRCPSLAAQTLSQRGRPFRSPTGCSFDALARGIKKTVESAPARWNRSRWSSSGALTQAERTQTIDQHLKRRVTGTQTTGLMMTVTPLRKIVARTVRAASIVVSVWGWSRTSPLCRRPPDDRVVGDAGR